MQIPHFTPNILMYCKISHKETDNYILLFATNDHLAQSINNNTVNIVWKGFKLSMKILKLIKF